jgi:hypothetical protein
MTFLSTQIFNGENRLHIITCISNDLTFFLQKNQSIKERRIVFHIELNET